MKLFGLNFGKTKQEPVITGADSHSLSLSGTDDNSTGLNVYRETKTNRWVHFGNNNRFPNYLNDLVNSSGLHSAIIDFKKNLIQGDGYDVTFLPFGTDVKHETAARQFMNRPNQHQTLEQLIEQVTVDYLIHATVYLKIFWNSDHTKIIKLERIEPSRIRVGYNRTNPDHPDRYYHCVDWDRQGEWPVTEYPAYDITRKDPIQIYRYIVPNSALIFNTLPAYAASINWIQLDGEISTFQKSNIENSLNPSVTIKFYKKPANDEEKRKIVKGIERQFKGSNKAGKAMIFFSDDKETAPDVEPVQVSALDKQFTSVSDSIQRAICYSHSINPSLLGLKTPGSLGGSTELETAYEVFKKVVVEPAQRDIEQIINKFTKQYKFTVTLKSPDLKYTSN